MEQAQAFPGPEIRPALDALGLEFLAGILEVEVGRNPGNLAALAELGHVYTRSLRFEKGLDVDLELVRRCPQDPTAHYNLACSLSLLGRTGPALDSLERSVELGYEDLEHLLADEDLAGVRGESRFQSLARRLGAALDSSSGPG